MSRIRGLLRAARRGIKAAQRHPGRLPMFRLTAGSGSRGRVLLSYSTQVYERLLAGQPLDRSHVAAWQNFQISRTFLDLGFSVDVMAFNDQETVPAGPYEVLVDVASNLGRLADRVGPDCRRILHPTFVHWAVHNACTYARHAALLERRGLALSPNRALPANTSAEAAEFITCRGGPFATRTFSHGAAEVLPVPQLTPAALDEVIERDMEDCRRRFLWIGGNGMVHKGLDLTLEAFAALPDCELYVCGRVAKEERFASLYHRELNELPNIHTIGWIDTMSDDFRHLVSRCAAVIMPSAAELACGSIIAGMMTGLIPVATFSADIDLDGVGVLIEDATVEAVQRAVLTVAEERPSVLLEMSRVARDVVGQRYGRGRFLDAYRAGISRALGVEPLEPWTEWNAALRIPKIDKI